MDRIEPLGPYMCVRCNARLGDYYNNDQSSVLPQTAAKLPPHRCAACGQYHDVYTRRDVALKLIPDATTWVL